MYVIRDKTSFEAIIYHYVEYDSQITATDFYDDFDPETMEMAWTQGETESFPSYFNIDQDHKAIALTLEEAVTEGYLQLQSEEKIVDDKIVLKSNQELVDEDLLTLNDPFEYVDQKDEIQRYTVAEFVEKDLIKTQALANACLKELDDTVQRVIQPEYSIGYESKLTKRYLEWMNEGKPANDNDNREEKFLTMQRRIDEIRLEHKGLREQIKTLLETLKA